MEPVLLTLVICVALVIPASVFLLPVWMRSRERLRILDLVQTLAQADRPLSAEIIQNLPGSAPLPNSQRDLRKGVMLAAVGLAFILLGLCAFAAIAGGGAPVGAGIAFGMGIAAVGAIPLCIGGALIYLSRSER